MVVFLAKMGAPVRGIWRERKSFKSGGFFGKNGCTSKGYVVRETSLASHERESCFLGLAVLASQKWWFFWQKWVHRWVLSKGLASLAGSNKKSAKNFYGEIFLKF